MGYNLYIGEAKPIIHMSDRHARMGVQEEWGKSLGAPLNPSNNYSNKIWPGYIVWRRFTYQVGLYSVFYAPECPEKTNSPFSRCKGADCSTCRGHSVWWIPEGGSQEDGREGLMANRPGAAKLTQDHLTAFKTARQAWLNLPEKTRQEEGVGPDSDGNPVDWVLRRLDWLVWWTEWALENCEHPTFAND